MDGGHAGLPNRVLLYQHLYSWELLPLVKTGEKRCVWVFLPKQSFTIGTPTSRIFFFSKLLKLCGSNWKEAHLFLDRLTWLVETLQIYCITEVELGRESLPNCNQAGTINCFETISLLFPLLFFQWCFYELMVHVWFFYLISTAYAYCKCPLRWQGQGNSML